MLSALSRTVQYGAECWKPHVLGQPAGFQETVAKSSAEFPKAREFLGNSRSSQPVSKKLDENPALSFQRLVSKAQLLTVRSTVTTNIVIELRRVIKSNRKPIQSLKWADFEALLFDTQSEIDADMLSFNSDLAQYRF